MSIVWRAKDYRLITAEILYSMPDHPGILQSYIWQDLDIAPDYPVLRKFLEFWKRELDGPVRSVRVASSNLVKPASRRHPGVYLHLN
ncbi:MAG: Usg family protein [Acetobacteraceae bacterium]|nr:Usg family protein [Acetobacteraceae bacterium]